MSPGDILAAIDAGHPPPEGLAAPLRALWLAQAGDWEGAHTLAQAAGNRDGDWVHAYLHRVEGDLGNAQYWYSRAGRPMPAGTLPSEWRQLVDALAACPDKPGG